MRWHKATPLERTAQVLAAYCFAVLILLSWKPAFTNASQPVRGIRDPMLAMQMARTLDEVDDVLSDAPSADREVMRLKLNIDYGLIVGYVALAIVIGIALFSGWRGIAVALMLLTILAGGHNARENFLIQKVVNLPLADVTPHLLCEIHRVSFGKWGSLAAGGLLLGGFSLTRTRWQTRVIGVVQFCGAAFAVAGFFFNPMLVWSGVLMAFGLILSAATLRLLTNESAT